MSNTRHVNVPLSRPFLKSGNEIPTDLPFFDIRPDFLRAIANPVIKVVVVKSPTGSGKSVAGGIALAEAGFDTMITIPTVVATKEIAKYVGSNALNSYDVGYACLGDRKYSDSTKLKYVTTKHGFNILKKVLSGKRRLPHNFVFVLDEAHHTSQENKGTLKLALRAIKIGLLSKLVIMSATMGTMNIDDFASVTLETAGRLFPIVTHWGTSNIDPANTKDAIIRTVERVGNLASDGTKKGILVFADGEGTVEEIASRLEADRTLKVKVARLYSKMPTEEMDYALEAVDPEFTKIIVSTNIAESSVTVPRISRVVDMGMQKTPYENTTFGTKLITEFASKDKLTQRKGRAGRTEPGEYYPMFTESKFTSFKDNDLSDMERLTPYEMVLELLDEGLDAQDILEISPEKYDKIIRKLLRLEMMDESFKITELGRTVPRFPFSLENSLIAIKGADLTFPDSSSGAYNDPAIFATLILIAMIEGSQGGSFFWIPREFRKPDDKRDFMSETFGHMRGENDLVTYIKIFASMFHEPESHRDKDIAKWAREASMNNKVLKAVRRNFKQLVSLTFPNMRGFPEDFITDVLARYQIYDLNILASPSVMECIYPLFEQAYSECRFKPVMTMKGVVYMSSTSSAHKIDNGRSFSEMTERPECEVFALQVVEAVCGTRSSRFISCVFPAISLTSVDVDEVSADSGREITMSPADDDDDSFY